MPGGLFSVPEHLPPPLPKVKRPPEEIEKSATRLATPRKEKLPTDDHMLAKTVTKPKADIEKTSDRLYTQAMEKQKRRQEKLKEEEARPLSPRKEATPDEIAEGVQHLYTAALDARRHKHEQLVKMYQFAPPKSPRANREETNSRVYTAALEKRKEKMAKLFDKYVTHSLPHYKKMTPDQIKESGERLCKKG